MAYSTDLQTALQETGNKPQIRWGSPTRLENQGKQWNSKDGRFRIVLRQYGPLTSYNLLAKKGGEFVRRGQYKSLAAAQNAAEASSGQLAEATKETSGHLRPLFRGLFRTIEARQTRYAEGDFQAAKKATRFDMPADLDALGKAAKPNSSQSQLDRAFDVFWQSIVGSSDAAVKALTGRTRKSWLDFEESLTKAAKK